MIRTEASVHHTLTQEVLEHSLMCADKRHWRCSKSFFLLIELQKLDDDILFFFQNRRSYDYSEAISASLSLSQQPAQARLSLVSLSWFQVHAQIDSPLWCRNTMCSLTFGGISPSRLGQCNARWLQGILPHVANAQRFQVFSSKQLMWQRRDATTPCQAEMSHVEKNCKTLLSTRLKLSVLLLLLTRLRWWIRWNG